MTIETIESAANRLRLMTESGQDKNNEAIAVALEVMKQHIMRRCRKRLVSEDE